MKGITPSTTGPAKGRGSLETMPDMGSKAPWLLQPFSQMAWEAHLDLLNDPVKILKESAFIFLVLFLSLSPSLTETGEAVALSPSPQTDSGHRLSVWVATE